MKNISSPGSTAFFKAVFAWVLLGLIGTSSLRGQTSPLNDSNFFTARDLWFSDQAAATATYGHIKDLKGDEKRHGGDEHEPSLQGQVYL